MFEGTNVAARKCLVVWYFFKSCTLSLQLGKIKITAAIITERNYLVNRLYKFFIEDFAFKAIV